MSNYAMGPTTYEQLRWSAKEFRRLADNAWGVAAREPEFRAALYNGDQDAYGTTLTRCVNQWGCRIPPDKAGEIASAVAAAAPYLEPLSASALEFNDLRCSTLDVIERAFDILAEVNGVDPTAASAILTALNPQLFVPWGEGVRDAYFPGEQPTGATYSQFLTVMRMAALSISADARGQHGIDDPAGRLSLEHGIEPAFSLATFIDEYNWLTLERRLADTAVKAVAV